MLLSSIPVISEAEEQIKPAKAEPRGEIPSPVNIPQGCGFNTRCRASIERCFVDDPEIIEIKAGHSVRCHLFGKPNFETSV